jgi:hypothetical protein
MSYIEREPLLEILNGLYNHHLTMHNYSADGATHDCIEAVIEAPSVDVKSKVAMEIFAEIEKHIQAELKTLSIFDEDEDDFYTGEKFGLEEISKKLAELKNKYTEVNK